MKMFESSNQSKNLVSTNKNTMSNHLRKEVLDLIKHSDQGSSYLWKHAGESPSLILLYDIQHCRQTRPREI